MNTIRWAFVVGVLGIGTLGGCTASPEDAQDATELAALNKAALNKKKKPFDASRVLENSDLRNSKSMSVRDVQGFLDKTPWGNKSPLATYKKGGKSAAEIIVETSEKSGVNPRMLLVRAQTESGLISKKSASLAEINAAFSCGQKGNAKSVGFKTQAACAAGTLRRAMDKADSEGTVTGWQVGREKTTKDGHAINPKNAATAALYTYTPYAGRELPPNFGADARKRNALEEAGEKVADAVQSAQEKLAERAAYIGGVKAIKNAWDLFQEHEALLAASKNLRNGLDNVATDLGQDPPPAADEPTTTPPPSTPTDPPPAQEEEPQPEPKPAPTPTPTPEDTTPEGTPPAEDGSDDEVVVGEGNVFPAENADTELASTGDDDDRDDTRRRLPPLGIASSGCSMTTTLDADAPSLLFGAAGVAIAFTRRRVRRRDS